jgi:tRNA A-37 threonylcarbamoyl transferase component Bud32
MGVVMPDSHEPQSQINVAHLSPDQVTSLARMVFAEEPDEAYINLADVEQIAGYHIESVLGEGASSIVYHVTRAGWNDSFALKLYRRPIADDAGTHRAMREVDLAEQISIPGMPRLLEHGIHNGHLFLVWDLVQGVPIDEYCRLQQRTTRQRVELLIEVTRIVERLHQAGVIHRDLSPSNILVDGAGKPHVIDLGIARIFENATSASSVTSEGSPLGSLAFMAPEQARGDISMVSTRSDQYGLGAIAYYLLSDHTPHDMDTSLMEALRRVGTHPPRVLRHYAPDLPRELGDVVMKAIAPDPEARYETAAAFRDDLTRWLRGYPVLAQPAPWWRRVELSIRRRPQRWAWGSLSGAAILVLSVLAVIGFVQSATARAELNLLQDVRAQEADLQARTESFAEQEKQQRLEAQQLLEQKTKYLNRLQELRNDVLDQIIASLEWVLMMNEQGKLDDALGLLMVMDEAVNAANEFDGKIYQRMSDTRFGIVVNALQALYGIEEGTQDPGFDAVRDALQQYEESRVDEAPPMNPVYTNQ